jgi:hypothetical protein
VLRGLVEGLVRLVLLPFRLAWALVVTLARLLVTVVALPVRVLGVLMRVAGPKAVVAFVLGAVVALLVAPGPGRELRARLVRLVGAGGPTDEELADKVVFELGHAPRTWHLPQPEVTVIDRRVVLRGSVPHGTARDELVRVAAGIPGVAGVDDQLVVEEVAASEG